MAKLNPTKNDLSAEARSAVIALLEPSLAAAVDLRTQAKQAHWTVKGPHFLQLHELFDKAADELDEHADDLAERMIQLGGQTAGTARAAAAQSPIEEYPLAIRAGRDHVEAFSNRLAAFGKLIRENIDKAAAAGDADTADLFTEISRAADKLLWFVEAHLEADAGTAARA
ncbi:MAG: DNA starvation/stationary phase protection protein Dps [Bryobacteraceae bacterium]|nr:DNA starvation/stationary phase protection protein Dps [Bryobacteraceae bacterium]